MTDREFRKAWLEIAEAFDTPINERTNRQCKLTSQGGLCWAWNHFTGNRYIEDIRALGRYSDVAGWWGNVFDEDFDFLRCLHALWFATIGLKSFNEVTKA